jgi:[ribosomal protein S18]-alanine N-acetyltransferase
MSQGVIRIFQPTDLDQIVELEIKCFGEKNAYAKGQLKYLILNAHSYCLVEEQENHIRGFIIVLFRKKSHIAGIETLNVDPAYRGLGIGKKLLLAAESEMKARLIKKVRLEVSAGNTFAIGLYEKVGFKKMEILKKYYHNISFETYDAYQMVKELSY